MDLIDREQAINAVDIGNLHRGIVEALQNIISELPSEEKTGRWLYYLDNGRRRCKCSNCLTSYGCLDTPYCPNCGARMVDNNE